ncbi:MAG: 2,3-bisphosphoglycerate-independent phosphoglycerate mutase [Actinomycetota bacterium]
MPSEEVAPSLATHADSKIVLVVMDGLGGFRSDARGSELHAAQTPHLDSLAAEGSSGLHMPVGPGITPGSGAGHLALFGYDPLVFQLGRGALSAAGIGFDLKPGDVAARVNFCTIDSSGSITDRRAGRISSEENQRLCRAILEGAHIEGTEIFLETEREHRGLLVLRGDGLSPDVADTDPQVNGVPPMEPAAISPEGGATAEIVSSFLDQAREILRDEKANFLLLRGFDNVADLPQFPDRYRMKGIGIAAYPMYLGISRILGIEAARTSPDFSEEVETLRSRWDDFDFFFIHQKKTDTAGEDGDFDRKVAAIEEVDAEIPAILEPGPEVICVTGDHSTPSQLKSHSWHPVPFVIRGPAVGADPVEVFDEQAAIGGALGLRLGKDLMALMLAAGGRLMKFGA